MKLAVARRVGLGVSDQILSSVTNFAVSFLVARSVGPSGLGAFSLAFATYLLALGVSRAMNTEPLVIRYSTGPRESWRAGTAAATGASLACGIIAGSGCLLVSFACSGTTAGVFRALAIGFPGLLLQDSWRWAFVAAGRTGLAVANDFAWAVVMFPIVGVLLATGHASASTITLTWALAGTAAAALGVLQARVLPGGIVPLAWWRRHRDLGPRYVAEYLLTGGATELTIFAVGGIAGLAAVGALRAATLIVGPFNVVLMGISLVLVPEGARLLRQSEERLARAGVSTSAALLVIITLWGGIAFAIPASLGRHLLRANWGPAHSVLLGSAAYAAASGIASGPSIGLRALAAARRSLRARLITGPLVVVGGITGCSIAGAQGAAWGMALGNGLAAFAWWGEFAAGIADYRATGGKADESESGLAANAPAEGLMTGAELAGAQGAAPGAFDDDSRVSVDAVDAGATDVSPSRHEVSTAAPPATGGRRWFPALVPDRWPSGNESRTRSSDD